MAQPQRIMIIRHAEKPYDDGKEDNKGVRMDGSSSEESLAVRGWQRAGAIALLFGSTELAQSRGLSVPQHLYSSNPDKADKIGGRSRRPKQTLIPLAQRLDFKIYATLLKGQEARLCRDVLKRAGIVLISWQHEMIPAIAAAIPGGNIPQTRIWDDERFDLVWVFDLQPDGTYSFKEVHQALLSGDLDIQCDAGTTLPPARLTTTFPNQMLVIQEQQPIDPIPDTGTAKDIRKLVKSVFIPALPMNSWARQIAEAADDPTDADSFLRGKAEFDQAAKALLELPGSSQDGKILFRDANQGGLTEAGIVVALWQKASADRTTIFSGVGASGPTILTVQVDGVDLDTLWQNDEFGEPLKADGNAEAFVRVFETAPSLTLPKQPDADNGVIIWEHGEQVSVKRRGNTSRGDPKINISVYLDNDEESGIPRQLCLLNSMRDPSYQRVRLAYDLLGLAKCPVRPSIYAELTLNGFYYGTYVAMPPLDDYHFKKLLPGVKHRAIFKGNYGDDLPGGAPLAMRGSQATDYFTPDSRPESRSYEPRNDTPDSDYAALAAFISTFHSQDPASTAFVDTVRKILDVEQFLRTMVVVNLLGSWDTYYLNSQNYFLHLAVDDSGNKPPFGTFALNDVDSLLGVSWTGQKRNWQDKDLLYRGTEIGKIPLITKLLANPKFQTYYLDFMEWFINKHFNVASVQAIETSRWSILEQTVYLESDTPYGAPHTNRPWSNDQVYRASVLGQMLSADQGPVGGIQVIGIDSFIDARCKKVLRQLMGMTRSSSGVDFDSDNWVLPA